MLPCGFLSTATVNTPPMQEQPSQPSTRQHPATDPELQEFEYNSEEEDNYPQYYSPVPPQEISRSIDEYNIVISPRDNSSHPVEQRAPDNAAGTYDGC